MSQISCGQILTDGRFIRRCSIISSGIGGLGRRRGVFEVLRRSLPHPSPPLSKGRGQEQAFPSYRVYRSLLELMRRSLPHPNPPLGKGRGHESHFSRGNSSHIKLKVVNDNSAPPLSKGRLGGVEISAASQITCVR